MTDKIQIERKNIICFKLNLEAQTIALLESLYLELIICGDGSIYEEKSLGAACQEQIKGIMKLFFTHILFI